MQCPPEGPLWHTTAAGLGHNGEEGQQESRSSAALECGAEAAAVADDRPARHDADDIHAVRESGRGIEQPGKEEHTERKEFITFFLLRSVRLKTFLSIKG